MLDGASGTDIQSLAFGDSDLRGERFRHHRASLDGNNDLLVLTQPESIVALHTLHRCRRRHHHTNTFSSTAVAQREYGLADPGGDPRPQPGWGDTRSPCRRRRPGPRRPSALGGGAIGPTNVTLSLSPRVEDPAYRTLTFAEVCEAYRQQIVALVEGGVDLLLIETIFDTLNAKAAIVAARRHAVASGIDTPLMISGTITDRSGRTLSGQTVDAFWQSVRHAHPVTVGLNCALGGAEMRPHVHELAERRRHARLRLSQRRTAERARLLRRDARSDGRHPG